VGGLGAAARGPRTRGPAARTGPVATPRGAGLGVPAGCGAMGGCSPASAEPRTALGEPVSSRGCGFGGVGGRQGSPKAAGRGPRRRRAGSP